MNRTSIQSKNISQQLQSVGIKPSYQRIRIYQNITETMIHPTADTIFNGLIEEIPTLSRTTVYNTLKLFVEKGIVSTITIEEKENRYDANTSFHGHFKCEQCGKLYDFDLGQDGMKIKGLEDFVINHRHVYFKGVCKNCIN